MGKNELLDIFNVNKVHLGVATREEAHAKGLWHQTFHCWVIRREGDKKYILFQLRSADAEIYPSKLDISAAGHLLAGEDPAVDGLRELSEELGVSAKIDQLIPLGWYHLPVQIDEFCNNEFPHTFLLEHSIHPQEYTVDPDEVSGLYQVELEDAIALAAGDIDGAVAVGFKLEGAVRGKVLETRYVSREDFAGGMASYFLRAFISAERYFEGKRPLVI